jgi:hypothetical protein
VDYQIARLSRNSRPQTQIGIRMGICVLWRQGFTLPLRLADRGNDCQVEQDGLRLPGNAEGNNAASEKFLRDISFNVIAVRRKVFL